MDTATINALITCATSILTCALGIWWGKRDTSSPNVKKIRELQLTNIYEPLDKMFSLEKDCTTEEKIKRAFVVLENNYKLVPKILLEEYTKVIQEDDTAAVDFVKFQQIISANYNWIKKKLNYPYDSSCIKRDFLPTYERNEIVRTIFFGIGAFIWMLCLLLLAILVMKPELRNTAPTFLMPVVIVYSVGFGFNVIAHCSNSEN